MFDLRMILWLGLSENRRRVAVLLCQAALAEIRPVRDVHPARPHTLHRGLRGAIPTLEQTSDRFWCKSPVPCRV